MRLRLTKTGTTTPNKANYWTKVREFTVNKKFTDGERIYTNIEKLKETPIHIYENEFRIRDIKDLELKPNEYVGIKMTSLVSVSDIFPNQTNLKKQKYNIQQMELNGQMRKFQRATTDAICPSCQSDK